MPTDAVTAQHAARATICASHYLIQFRPDPRNALAVIGRYAECHDFETGDQVRAEKWDEVIHHLKSIICSTVADCHRGLGDVRAAAEWYRRAGENWKVGGFPPIYAELVLRHELTDHYEMALDCLRHNLADWMSRPLLTRIYWSLASGWLWRPWLYGWTWRTWFRQKRHLSELEARIK